MSWCYRICVLLLLTPESSIGRCVEVFLHTLRAEGILEGGEVYPKGLPMPDGGEVIDLHVPSSKVSHTAKQDLSEHMVWADQ